MSLNKDDLLKLLDNLESAVAEWNNSTAILASCSSSEKSLAYEFLRKQASEKLRNYFTAFNELRDYIEDNEVEESD